MFERFQQILDKARQNKSKDKPDAELDEFEKVSVICEFEAHCSDTSQILEEHRLQGQEDQALQDRVAKKAKKRAKTTGKGMLLPDYFDVFAHAFGQAEERRLRLSQKKSEKTCVYDCLLVSL